MNPSESIFTKYELPLFFLLTYLLSWWIVPFLQGGMLAQGPAFAAVIIIALTAGRQGLREFWGRLTNFRAGWWYLIGPAIIAAYLLAAFVVNILLGATVVSPFPFPSIGTMIILLLMGGIWEEPGWTGYALPKLQERFASRSNGPMIATLILGFFRALWHLPLFLYGTLPWYDIFIFIIAFQLMITWLYNKTKGSVPAVMLFHYASNVLTGSTMLLVFSGSAKTTYHILFVICASFTALLIAWKSKFKLG